MYRALQMTSMVMSEPRAFTFFEGIDLDQSGCIEAYELQLVLYQISLLPHPRAPMPREVFSMFDSQKRGFLDADEFRYAAAAFGHEMSAEKSLALFTQVDIEKAGHMDFDKFVEAWCRLVDAAAELRARGLGTALDGNESAPPALASPAPPKAAKTKPPPKAPKAPKEKRKKGGDGEGEEGDDEDGEEGDEENAGFDEEDAEIAAAVLGDKHLGATSKLHEVLMREDRANHEAMGEVGAAAVCQAIALDAPRCVTLHHRRSTV